MTGEDRIRLERRTEMASPSIEFAAIATVRVHTSSGHVASRRQRQTVLPPYLTLENCLCVPSPHSLMSASDHSDGGPQAAVRRVIEGSSSFSDGWYFDDDDLDAAQRRLHSAIGGRDHSSFGAASQDEQYTTYGAELRSDHGPAYPPHPDSRVGRLAAALNSNARANISYYDVMPSDGVEYPENLTMIYKTSKIGKGTRVVLLLGVSCSASSSLYGSSFFDDADDSLSSEMSGAFLPIPSLVDVLDRLDALYQTSSSADFSDAPPDGSQLPPEIYAAVLPQSVYAPPSLLRGVLDLLLASSLTCRFNPTPAPEDKVSPAATLASADRYTLMSLSASDFSGVSIPVPPQPAARRDGSQVLPGFDTVGTAYMRKTAGIEQPRTPHAVHEETDTSKTPPAPVAAPVPVPSPAPSPAPAPAASVEELTSFFTTASINAVDRNQHEQEHHLHQPVQSVPTLARNADDSVAPGVSADSTQIASDFTLAAPKVTELVADVLPSLSSAGSLMSATNITLTVEEDYTTEYKNGEVVSQAVDGMVRAFPSSPPSSPCSVSFRLSVLDAHRLSSLQPNEKFAKVVSAPSPALYTVSLPAFPPGAPPAAVLRYKCLAPPPELLRAQSKAALSTPPTSDPASPTVPPLCFQLKVDVQIATNPQHANLKYSSVTVTIPVSGEKFKVSGARTLPPGGSYVPSKSAFLFRLPNLGAGEKQLIRVMLDAVPGADLKGIIREGGGWPAIASAIVEGASHGAAVDFLIEGEDGNASVDKGEVVYKQKTTSKLG